MNWIASILCIVTMLLAAFNLGRMHDRYETPLCKLVNGQGEAHYYSFTRVIE